MQSFNGSLTKEISCSNCYGGNMRSFFSPFIIGSFSDVGTTVDNYMPESVVVAATVFEQFNRKIFLLTVDNKSVVDRLGWCNKYQFKLTGYRIGARPFLFIRPELSGKYEAKAIHNKGFTILRSENGTFLPKTTHKRTNIAAYLDIKSGQLAVALPDTYNVKAEYNDDQPDFGALYNAVTKVKYGN